MFISHLVLALLIGFMIVPALVGLFTFYHWFREQKSPADASNRINGIRLWWFALTREDLFVDDHKWLGHDEMDNLDHHYDP